MPSAKTVNLTNDPFNLLQFYSGESFGEGRWRVQKNGDASCLELTGGAWGADLVTTEDFEHFKLDFQVKLDEMGNTGIFWGIIGGKNLYDYPIYMQGPELQLVQKQHPDAKKPKNSTSALYDILAPEKKFNLEKDTFYKVMLIKTSQRIEHWINGELALSYSPQSFFDPHFLVGSKFDKVPAYGQHSLGKVGIQDHAMNVTFCNMTLERL
jgi:hypothetical protein